LDCNVNIVYGNLKNSQDYVQKPQRNCTFMNTYAFHANRNGLSTVHLCVYWVVATILTTTEYTLTQR
jgi:hypothetical protein